MRVLQSALLLLALLPLVAVAQQSPTGRWKTIDDETGKVKSIVEITQAADGTLQGKVVDVLQSRSEEHTSDLQSLMRIPYAVLCLRKAKTTIHATYCTPN